jgi:hypothetical protein
MRYWILATRYSVLMVSLVALSGCTEPSVMADNYLTYDHPFNDAAAEKVRRSAEKICKQRNQAAVKTRSVCSLTRCFTDYQCVNPKDPLEYQPPGWGPGS